MSEEYTGEITPFTILMKEKDNLIKELEIALQRLTNAAGPFIEEPPGLNTTHASGEMHRLHFARDAALQVLECRASSKLRSDAIAAERIVRRALAKAKGEENE